VDVQPLHALSSRRRPRVLDELAIVRLAMSVGCEPAAAIVQPISAAAPAVARRSSRTTASASPGDEQTPLFSSTIDSNSSCLTSPRSVRTRGMTSLDAAL
jgi:hypothetical protein